MLCKLTKAAQMYSVAITENYEPYPNSTVKKIFLTLLLATLAGWQLQAENQLASCTNYLHEIVAQLELKWPKNRTVNIVCHGHSVPAGYAKTPLVDPFSAYPDRLHHALKERFPYAVINVIVTGIGGENSVRGEKRFADEVLTHRPDVVLIDYALNDRGIGLAKAKAAWESMIQKALAANVKVILLTPTADSTAKLDDPNDPLNQHAEQIRKLAAQYQVGLVDSLAAFKAETARGVPLNDLLAQKNHPNARGHALVVNELIKWFPASH